jgi:HSP20 family protein
MPSDGRSLSSDPVFDRLERQMDDMVQRLLRRPSPASYQRAWAPRLDVYETDDQFVIVAELAGIDPQAVTIEIEGAEVAMTGARMPPCPPQCAQGGEPLQLEIPFGEFERRLVLPSAVDAESASADFSEGILTVQLPKLRQGPTRVQVEVRSTPADEN